MSYLIYDGDCPVCSRYAEFAALKRKMPDLELIDARTNFDHPAVRMVRAKGLVLDDGMAYVDGEDVVYGGDVMRKLDHHSLAGHYKLLKFGRAVLLRLLGRKKMGF